MKRISMILLALVLAPFAAKAEPYSPAPVTVYSSSVQPASYVSAQAAARDSRYQAVAKSLEALLNEGWMITQAFATQKLDGVILEMGGKYIHCKLSNTLRSTGPTLQSECYTLN